MSHQQTARQLLHQVMSKRASVRSAVKAVTGAGKKTLDLTKKTVSNPVGAAALAGTSGLAAGLTAGSTGGDTPAAKQPAEQPAKQPMWYDKQLIDSSSPYAAHVTPINLAVSAGAAGLLYALLSKRRRPTRRHI